MVVGKQEARARRADELIASWKKAGRRYSIDCMPGMTLSAASRPRGTLRQSKNTKRFIVV